MKEYGSDYEKQEQVNELVRKAGVLRLLTYIIAVAALILYIDMRKSRYIPSGTALWMLIVLAIISLSVRIARASVMRCPFCGGALSRSSKNFTFVPKHCPNCGEKLKY